MNENNSNTVGIALSSRPNPFRCDILLLLLFLPTKMIFLFHIVDQKTLIVLQFSTLLLKAVKFYFK